MIKLTSQQKIITELPPAKLLISAAAGSGKTFVMTQRIVDRLKSRQISIDELLVMTFTDAAAKSMREKIESSLKKSLEQEESEEQRRHIAGCIRALPSAHISTIHSFCLDVIRNFYYEAKGNNGEPIVEPEFRVEDQGEAKVLFAEAIEEIFEESYEFCDDFPESEKGTSFLKLVDTYGNGKDDTSLKNMIIQFYSFLRSVPDYSLVIDDMLIDLKKTAEDFNNSNSFKKIVTALKLRIQNALEGIDDLNNLLITSPVFLKDKSKNEERIATWEELIFFVRQLDLIVNNPTTTWDDIYNIFLNVPDVKLARGSSEEKDELRRIFIRHYAELLFMGTGNFDTDTYNGEFLFKTEYIFNADCEKIKEDLLTMYPIIDEFFKTTKKVDERYTKLKQSINVIDFNDFEHLALMILRKNNVKDYYKGRYKEVYVDEYQDTSRIQEEIVSLVTSNNLFMVGDVKQSIYRFRHAKPEIFINKMKLFKNYEEENRIFAEEGTLLNLNKNFRSLPCVLDAVNDVFSQIMTLEAGEVDYSNGHELFYDFCQEPSTDKVKVLLTDVDSITEELEEENLEMSSYSKEACTVASEIVKLLEEGISPGDIAILARTRNICGQFSDVLESLGIPVIREQGEDIPDIYELRVLESLLTVLDNPKQDIPLVSVMRSPVFGSGFDENELLKLRTELNIERGYFHECCQKYLIEGKDEKLKSKLNIFFDLIATYRNMTQYMNPGDVLAKVLRDTQLILYASSMPDGNRRIKYLNRFADWVRMFCSTRRCGVHELVKYIEELNDKSSGERPFAVEESTSDRVKIMTIHKSKGLEYKVVFLVGTSGRIRASSGSDNILIADEGLPGIWFIDSENQYKYPTPTVFAASESKRKSELAEEMRLLYVAMTRAEEKLFISGTYKGVSSTDEGKGINGIVQRTIKNNLSKSLSPQLVLSAKSMLDWIIMALARNPYADFSCIGINEKSSFSAFEHPHFSGWDILSFDGQVMASKIPEIAQKIKDINLMEDTSTELIEDQEGSYDEDLYQAFITKKFFSTYRLEAASKKPLKFAVGEIKRRPEYIDDEDLNVMNYDESSKGMNLKVYSPNEYLITKITPERIGVIVHNFIRYADISKLNPNCTTKKIINHVEEMEKFEMFTSEEAKILVTYCENFVKYFNSSLAKRIYYAYNQKERSVFNEVPFTIALPCTQFCREKGFEKKDSILVQGIIDLWFLEEERAVIVDYKTDRLSGSDEYVYKELNKRYGVQLSMYAIAVSKIWGIKIKEAVIWLLPKNKEYIISIDENISI